MGFMWLDENDQEEVHREPSGPCIEMKQGSDGVYGMDGMSYLHTISFDEGTYTGDKGHIRIMDMDELRKMLDVMKAFRRRA